jgi:hypothetical protein
MMAIDISCPGLKQCKDVQPEATTVARIFYPVGPIGAERRGCVGLSHPAFRNGSALSLFPILLTVAASTQ